MLSDTEIAELKTKINGGNLVYRDVDGGVHLVVGFKSAFKEVASDPDEPEEPVFLLPHGKCVSVYTVDAEDFFTMEPALNISPSPSM